MNKKIGIKTFVFFAFTIFVSAKVFAQTGAVWVMPTEVSDLSVAEAKWLPGEVHRAFRQNFTNYTIFTVADEDADALAKIQGRSYNVNISEADVVRMGRQTGAKYVIRSTLKKTPNGYTFSAVFQDLEKGTRYAESSSSVKLSTLLYDTPGCAVNDVTVKLCKTLDRVFAGAELTRLTETMLMKGEDSISDEDQMRYYKEEEARIKKQIDDANKIIQQNTASTDEEAELQVTIATLQKQKLETLQKQNEARQKRIEEEAKQRLADLEKEAERSLEQKKRISEQQKILAEKIQEVRQSNFESASLSAKISQIEAKKKAVVEIRKDFDKDKEEITARYETEYLAKADEIMNAPLRSAQKDGNGNMLPQVRELRNDDIAVAQKEIYARRDSEIKEYEKNSEKAENELISQVKAQQKDLTAEVIADSIKNRDLRLYVSPYDGGNLGWNVLIVFDGKDFVDSNSSSLINYEDIIFLAYTDVTGKKLDTRKNSYLVDDNYLDTVDLWSSLFANNANPINAEIYYHVEPESSNKPSQYKIIFSKLVIKNTATGKKILSKNLSYSQTLSYEPAYDIRNRAVVAIAEKRTAEQKEAQKKQQEKKEAAQERKQAVSDWFSEKEDVFEKKYEEYGQLYNTIYADLSFDPKPGFDVGLTMTMLSHVFLCAEGGMLPFVGNLNAVASGYEAGYFAVGFGGNVRLKVPFVPNIFASIEMGMYELDLENGYIDNGYYEDNWRGALGKINVGVDIPIFRYLSVISVGSFFWTSQGAGFKFGIGIGISGSALFNSVLDNL